MKKKISGSRHHSLRLKGYDYSAEGLYFITICTSDRQHFFGKISNGEMIPNEIGKMAELFLMEVPKHFSHAMVAEQVVMPNHVHLILELTGNLEIDNGIGITDDGKMDGKSLNQGEGMMPSVGTCHGMSLPKTNDDIVGTRHGVSPHAVSPHAVSPHAVSPHAVSPHAVSPHAVSPHAVSTHAVSTPPRTMSGTSRQFGKPVSGSVSIIINQYKASVKRWCNKNGHEYFHWQSRFYDHIIRDEVSCQNILNYIVNNPKQWKDDKFY